MSASFRFTTNWSGAAFWRLPNLSVYAEKRNLFPELPFGHLGYRSTTISRWFTRFLENASAAAPLTCFHSFRHSFRDGLREAKIDRDIALLLGGWTTDGKGTAVADNYGSGYQPRALAEALNAVRFPALNLDHLAVMGQRRGP